MKAVNAKTLNNILDLNKPGVYCNHQVRHESSRGGQSLARGALLIALKGMGEQSGFEACQCCFNADGGC